MSPMRSILAIVLLAAGTASRAHEAAYQRVAAESYIAAARAALANSADEGLEIESSGAYRDVLVPVGALEMRPRVPRGVPRPRSVVWVDMMVDGRLRASLPVGFTLHRWERVLVAKERLPAKAVLDAEQFEHRTVDVAAVNGGAVREAGMLAGKRLRREIAAGAAISTSDLQDIPAVLSGEKIAVYARIGRVVVRTAAVAEHDAFAGDVIDARLPGTGESVHVRVSGNNTAWVSSNENTNRF